MLRSRSRAVIRRDAVRMGIAKAEKGCESCAAHYFELARSHGATEEEIRRALAASVGEQRAHDITRRTLLKGMAAGAATTAALASGLLPIEVAATSNYYGVDTNTVNCCGMPNNYYLGRTGYQTTMDASAFSTTAANQVKNTYGNYNRVHEYWDLGGPNHPNAGSNKYQWGVSQANAAINAWYHSSVAAYFYGQNIFGDIEANEWWD